MSATLLFGGVVPPKQPCKSSRYAVLDDGAGGRAFVKTYANDPDLEYRRGRALYQASVESKLFRTPEPIGFLESQGIIIWEYLDRLVGLRKYLIGHLERRPADKQARSKLFRRAGESLALIHERLPVESPPRVCWPFRETHSGSGILDRHVAAQLRESSLRAPHGDFSCVNIFLIENEGKEPTLAIIDPTPNRYLYSITDFGATSSIYFDIAQLFYTVRCHRPSFQHIKREVDGYLYQLTAGYAEAANIEVDAATVLTCAAEIAILYQRFLDKQLSLWSISNWRDRHFRLCTAKKLFQSALALVQKF